MNQVRHPVEDDAGDDGHLTFEDQRYWLIRDTMSRAHQGPHAMLRTLSAIEVEFLLSPVLSLLEEEKQRGAATHRLVNLNDARHSGRRPDDEVTAGR